MWYESNHRMGCINSTLTLGMEGVVDGEEGTRGKLEVVGRLEPTNEDVEETRGIVIMKGKKKGDKTRTPKNIWKTKFWGGEL